MHFCYVDESGTSEIPGNSSHFVLAGLAIPIGEWKNCDQEIQLIKNKYSLTHAEIHTAWLARPYIEEKKIQDFESLDYDTRRSRIQSYRTTELLRLQRTKNRRLYWQTKKNFRETDSYVHLTSSERKCFLVDLADCISNWTFAKLFAECIDKAHFGSLQAKRVINRTVAEQSFEQLVSRFEQYLQRVEKDSAGQNYGLLIHDNNSTVAKKHTNLMNEFHAKGTLWTTVRSIIETPLFVDSQLTSMVQLADLCGFALRRYLEKGETDLFERIYKRADQKDGIVVGIRHFAKKECVCRICSTHRRIVTGPLSLQPK